MINTSRAGPGVSCCLLHYELDSLCRIESTTRGHRSRRQGHKAIHTRATWAMLVFLLYFCVLLCFCVFVVFARQASNSSFVIVLCLSGYLKQAELVVQLNLACWCFQSSNMLLMYFKVHNARNSKKRLDKHVMQKPRSRRQGHKDTRTQGHKDTRPSEQKTRTQGHKAIHTRLANSCFTFKLSKCSMFTYVDVYVVYANCM
jgi:hypothetical protein